MPLAVGLITMHTWFPRLVHAVANCEMLVTMSRDNSSASDALVRAMLDAALDAIVGMDAHGDILEFSRTAESMFGYAREEAIGQPIVKLIPPDFRERHRTGLRRYLQTGQTVVIGKRVELRGLRKGGEEFPVELTVARVDLDGPPRFVGYIRDMTDSKHAEERREELQARIQQAQKLESLGVLAGGIAHDFNNILVGILGNSGLALNRLSPDSPVAELIRDIENAGQRAADLTNQMLAYSGKGRFVLRTIDLNDLIEEMAHLLKAVVSKKAVFRLNLDSTSPRIEGDPTQIRQVVMNLITNASDALEDQDGVIAISTGQVDVSRRLLTSTYPVEHYCLHCGAHADGTCVLLGGNRACPFLDPLGAGTYVFLQVSDTGCGMDEATQHKVFDPFFSTRFAGRGLGLAAVLGIVRGHRGTIKIYSQPNKGTTFKVLIPQSSDACAPPIEAAPGAGRWKGSGTVLAIDDEPMLLTVVGRTLEAVGFSVVSAQDPRAGLAIFAERAEEIVAVVLDLTMPHMDGQEAFRRLRQIRDDVPILLISGYNEQDAISRFAGKGLAGFLHKPFEPEALIGKLHDILQRTENTG